MSNQYWLHQYLGICHLLLWQQGLEQASLELWLCTCRVINSWLWNCCTGTWLVWGDGHLLWQRFWGTLHALGQTRNACFLSYPMWHVNISLPFQFTFVNTVVLSLFIDLLAIWIYLQTFMFFSAPYSWASTWLLVSYFMLKSLISQNLLFHERLQSCSFQWLSYPNQLWIPSHLVEKPPVSNRRLHIYLGHFWILKFHVLVGIDNSPKKICCILLRTFASVFIRDIDV